MPQQISLCPSLHLPSILPPTTPCRPEALSGVSHLGLTVGRIAVDAPCPRGPCVLGFAFSPAGSPRQQAESSLRWLTFVNLYCGLDVRRERPVRSKG